MCPVLECTSQSSKHFWAVAYAVIAKKTSQTQCFSNFPSVNGLPLIIYYSWFFQNATYSTTASTKLVYFARVFMHLYRIVRTVLLESGTVTTVLSSLLASVKCTRLCIYMYVQVLMMASNHYYSTYLLYCTPTKVGFIQLFLRFPSILGQIATCISLRTVSTYFTVVCSFFSS